MFYVIDLHGIGLCHCERESMPTLSDMPASGSGGFWGETVVSTGPGEVKRCNIRRKKCKGLDG